MKEKVNMLMILDGFGDNPNQDGNAIKLAKTPNIDRLMKKYPNTDIYASGPHVGLPEGQMGNYTKATISSRPERVNGHIGTETRPRLLREAAVGNIAQWGKP